MPITKALFSPESNKLPENSIPSHIYPLGEIALITRNLVAAWTQPGIEGFEEDPTVIELQAKLSVTKDASAQVSLAIQLKNQKALIYAKRIEFDKIALDYRTIFGMEVPIKNNQVLRQISVASEQLLNVGMQVAGLAGYGALAGGVTTPGLGSSLLGAIAEISEIFGSHSDPLVPMMANIVTELSNQHRVLLAEMALRHMDLKAQIGEQGLEIVTQFSNLDANVETIQETLALLNQRVKANETQQKHTFNSITQALAQVRDLLADKTTTDVIDIISNPINHIAYSGSEGYLDRLTVGELSSQLLTSIKETNKRVEVAGSSRVPTHATLLEWKISEQISSLSEYHINELRLLAAQYLPHGSIPVTSISNPLLWSYSTMGLLLLYRKQYATSTDKYANHITMAELNNVQEAFLEGQQIQGVMSRLRDPRIYESLLKQLQILVDHIKTHYYEGIDAFLMKKMKECNQKYDKTMLERKERDLNVLRSQHIDFSVHNEWFQIVRPQGGGYIVQGTQQKIAALETYYAKSNCALYPEPGVDGPVLPLVTRLEEALQSFVPAKVMESVRSNLAVLSYRYLIKDSSGGLLGGNKKLRIIIYFDDIAYDYHDIAYWDSSQKFFGRVGEGVWPFLNGRSTPLYIYTYPPGVRLHYTDKNKLAIKAENMLKLRDEQLEIDYNLEVMEDLKSKQESSLGRDLVAYLAIVKCLKTLIALCWHDEYEKTASDLNKFLQANGIPNSYEELLAYLPKNELLTGLDLFGKLETFLAHYKNNLPKILGTTRSSYYFLFENVLNQSSRFVDDYASTTVRVNPVIPFEPFDNEDTKDKKLEAVTESTAMLMDLMMSMKEELGHLNVSSIEKEQYWSATRSRVATFCDAHPHLLAESGIGPARLMAARGDSPVFGQRVVASVENGVVIDDASVSSSL